MVEYPTDSCGKKTTPFFHALLQKMHRMAPLGLSVENRYEKPNIFRKKMKKLSLFFVIIFYYWNLF